MYAHILFLALMTAAALWLLFLGRQVRDEE